MNIKRFLPILFMFASMVFCFSCEDMGKEDPEVTEPIEETDTGQKVVFSVLECNRNWSKSNPEEGFPVENATITIYNLDGNVRQTIDTDKNGKATFEIQPGETIYYTIEKNGLKNLYKGYVLAGVYTSEAEIDNSPAYNNGVTKKLGGLKFVDMNGDGVINEMDKVEISSFTGDETTNELAATVYIADDSLLTIEVVPIETIMEGAVYYYNRVYSDYIQIDNQYSSLESRQTIRPESQFIEKYWADSYSAIRFFNITLEESLPTAGISAEQKNTYKGLLLKYRASVYFYLTELFDRIRLLVSTDILEVSQIYQSPAVEIHDFVAQGLDEALLLLPQTEADSVCFMRALQLSQLNKTTEAESLLKRMVDSGNLKWVSDTENILYVQTYLLYAESLLKNGKDAEAVQVVNLLYANSGQAPILALSSFADEIKEAIRASFTRSNWDTGLKFLNQVRWGDTQTWGRFALLPIPAVEIMHFPNVTQNPGW